jgi:tetratricopeptide (TPR) repeat protein
VSREVCESRKASPASAGREEDGTGSTTPRYVDEREQPGVSAAVSGKYEEAEKLHRRALEGYEKELGVQHPDTLTNVSNLASVLRCQGRYSKAEKLNRRALEGREKELGVQHPSTLDSVYCLAYLLQKHKQYEEASELYQRAYHGHKQKLGSQHPITIGCLNNFSAMQQEAELEGLKQGGTLTNNNK